MRSGFYGYGFNVGTSSAARMELSHSGAFQLGRAPTSSSSLRRCRDRRAEQRHPGRHPETLTAEFADLVQFGEVREDWRKLYGDAFAGMSDPEGALVGKSPRPIPRPPNR